MRKEDGSQLRAESFFTSPQIELIQLILETLNPYGKPLLSKILANYMGLEPFHISYLLSGKAHTNDNHASLVGIYGVMEDLTGMRPKNKEQLLRILIICGLIERGETVLNLGTETEPVPHIYKEWKLL
ncbi:hypothetical protein GYA49_05025 [Candidatus Beckwithbacteria bacterium]|nr:hypothetical protein [Candidatus Beckwithbacteria bacterium]